MGTDPPPLKWSALRYGFEPRRITYYRGRQVGRAEVGSGQADEGLEIENGWLRRAIADLTLDKLILQEASRGNF